MLRWARVGHHRPAWGVGQGETSAHEQQDSSSVSKSWRGSENSIARCSACSWSQYVIRESVLTTFVCRSHTLPCFLGLNPLPQMSPAHWLPHEPSTDRTLHGVSAAFTHNQVLQACTLSRAARALHGHAQGGGRHLAQ